ncbi:MAG: DUF58 domain-containing protein [Candidatus Xenobia bacterium]
MRRRRPQAPTRLFPHLRRLYTHFLTIPGRIVLAVAFAAGLAGADPINTQVHLVFTIGVAAFVASVLVGPWFMPRRRQMRTEWHVPPRAVAGGTFTGTLMVANHQRTPVHLLDMAMATLPPGVQATPGQPAFDRAAALAAGEQIEFRRSFSANWRGQYLLEPPVIGTALPFGLIRFGFKPHGARHILISPRLHPIQGMHLFAGMRYQPGGIPLASSTGESLEFVGVREYRPGDSLRKIHWKLWARRGEPVVKEFQQEYYSRVALVLDTFMPKRYGADMENAFEGAVSTAASCAQAICDEESVLDLFAAGPQVYSMSVGRNLGFLQNVLDVLACIAPCHEPAFEKLEAAVTTHLSRVTAAVLVMLDLDATRLRFVQRFRQHGLFVKLLIVRDGPPTLDPKEHADAFAAWHHIHPATIEEDLRDL